MCFISISLLAYVRLLSSSLYLPVHTRTIFTIADNGDIEPALLLLSLFYSRRRLSNAYAVYCPLSISSKRKKKQKEKRPMQACVYSALCLQPVAARR